jgi:hypothetical protein
MHLYQAGQGYDLVLVFVITVTYAPSAAGGHLLCCRSTTMAPHRPRRGAHNVDYTAEILDLAAKDIRAVKAALK